jgi:hypothetical protein
MRFEGDMEGILAVGLRGSGKVSSHLGAALVGGVLSGRRGRSCAGRPAKTPQTGVQASVLILEKPKVPRTRS